jgi:hypothetical protein
MWISCNAYSTTDIDVNSGKLVARKFYSQAVAFSVIIFFLLEKPGFNESGSETQD